ncbi:hypothetical protein Tco_1534989, partial [Tanacetum coccineum]
VNPCNERDMWPVVESRIVIIPPLYKSPIGRPPKKRKKSNDDIIRKAAGVKVVVLVKQKVSGQAASATNISGQVVGARKVSGKAVGSRKVSGQAADARKASSQPSAAQSTSKQGPMQGFQGPIAGPAYGSQRKTKKFVHL